jgi:hypothetical protein
MRTAVAVAPLMAVAMACFEELPEPLTCPPEPRYSGSDCLPVLTAALPGCMNADQVGCLVGPRSTCSCLPDECPAPEARCFPGDDCPPLVREQGNEDADCLPLEPDNFALIEESAVCLCGCGGCAALCDGKGPVIAAVDNSDELFPTLVVDIRDELPNAGELGLYVRARGLANMTVVLATIGADVVTVFGAPLYPIYSPLSTSYSEHVLHRNELLSIEPYRWDRAEDKPMLVLLAINGTPENPATALAEVDCVVPFLVPR